MNIIYFVFQLSTIVCIVYLVLQIKYFLPSYFAEKGRNIATKEDVSEITSLVEKTKQVFTSETEKLKATLLVVTNSQIGIISEERNAIINLNEKYFNWLHSLTDISLGEIDEYDNTALTEYYQKIRFTYNDFLASVAKFNLFISDAPLLEILNKMQIETIKNLNRHVPLYILELKKINSQIELLKTTLPINEQSARYNEILESKHTYYTRFADDVLNGYETVAPINSEFQNKARAHIYKLIHSQLYTNLDYSSL